MRTASHQESANHGNLKALTMPVAPQSDAKAGESKRDLSGVSTNLLHSLFGSPFVRRDFLRTAVSQLLRTARAAARQRRMVAVQVMHLMESCLLRCDTHCFCE